MHKGRKISGGKYIKSRKKKAYEKVGQKKLPKLGDDKRKTARVRGGNVKVILLKGKTVNVMTKNRMQKTEIKNVLETPSNRFLARQNVITKGTIVQTDIGKVRITNRPTQEGILNGVLVE
ncbi:MAG: 30S ribosomal protein S8e [Nanoarchaeota archaeon]